MPIRSVEDLRAHVALARKVEMSTIPPYLYAAWSIKDPESDSARLIVSVAAEEMLHLALTTNLMLALGGEPDFGEDLSPTYACLLPHHQPDLMLRLAACSPDVIRDVFMVIERPQAHDALPEDDDYESLGQFYAALELAIDELGEGLFTEPQRDRQLSEPSFYGAVQFDTDDSGGLMLIDDVASAKEALEIIIHQGEGVGDDRWADPGHKELTHYYKFEQLADGTVPIGEVWPVMETPRTSDLSGDARSVSELFNALYSMLFLTMGEMFSGGADQGTLIGRLYGLMSNAMAPVGRHLMSMPIGDGVNAGPAFERCRFDRDPGAETLAMAEAVGERVPELASVAETVRGLVR